MVSFPGMTFLVSLKPAFFNTWGGGPTTAQCQSRRGTLVNKLLQLYKSQAVSLCLHNPIARDSIKGYYHDLGKQYEESHKRLESASQMVEFRFVNYLKDELYARSEELAQIATKPTKSDLAWLAKHYTPETHSFLEKYHSERIQTTFEISNYLHNDSLVQTIGARQIVKNAIKYTQDVLLLNDYPVPQILLDPGSDDAKIRCVAPQIQHVLFELLKNSTIPALRTDTPIRLNILSDPETTTIKITDSGGGMPPDIAHKIWQFHFTTATEQNKDEVNGFGMGIPLCSLLTRFNKGSLEIENRLGTGLVVLLKLPTR
ncbi:hypothetical protein KL942_001471 [Ogataea angusta]|uniref:Protein-serine/threonine kinase n=1 Tax=Pichia angusta TaxID=870730 RepID=A0AAN6DG67_PICAN|nr:uncharacterized protein KL928_002737 [Ogataea angusta]KAG7818869.1 hypothetical protein KL928_002737 [Ogataea angusta]KAG7830303.1 hypothetical protein KL920_001941 [Ogataea angusta]KAG7841592.1 hypothetical protein KL942_001471 [Ogataea angusta]KAG7850831.1 hypothetical protein KL940_001408 [Ogataea angusta]